METDADYEELFDATSIGPPSHRGRDADPVDGDRTGGGDASGRWTALREDRLPHIWCPGCGIGIAMGGLRPGARGGGVDLDPLSRRVRHRLHAAASPGTWTATASTRPTAAPIPFATRPAPREPRAQGRRLQRRRRPRRHRRQPPDPRRAPQRGHHRLLRQQLHLRDDGRTGRPDHPGGRQTSTTPYGAASSTRSTFRYLVAAAGATYVARWTVLDLGRLRRSMVEALRPQGLRVRRDRLAVSRLLRAAQPPRRGDRRAPLLQGEHGRRELRAAGGAATRPRREDRRGEVRREGAAHLRGAAHGAARPQAQEAWRPRHERRQTDMTTVELGDRDTGRDQAGRLRRPGGHPGGVHPRARGAVHRGAERGDGAELRPRVARRRVHEPRSSSPTARSRTRA